MTTVTASRPSVWRPRLIRAGCFTAGLVLALVAVQEVGRAYSHADEKLAVAGVANFGRLNAHLFRGAQPTAAGFAALRAMGVDAVVRLSTGDEGAATEEHEVTALGMRFVNLPWHTSGEPSPDQVVEFLSLVHDAGERRIFVHCKAGADRTGVMIALARVALEHWPVPAAIDEMRAFHYHPLFLPHLQRYVEAFPSTLLEDPRLRALTDLRDDPPGRRRDVMFTSRSRIEPVVLLRDGLSSSLRRPV